MNIIWYLLRNSWITVVIATFLGFLSGSGSALLMALVNNSINSNQSAGGQLIAGYVGLLVLTSLTTIISQYLLVRMSQSVIYKLRLRLSSWILSCPLRHLEELGASRLLAALTQDIDTISNAVILLPIICIDAAVILGCLVYLGWLSGFVLLFVVVLMSLAIATIKFLFRKAEILIKLAREEKDHLFKHFRTITDGIKELKLNSQRRQAFLEEELQVTAALWRNYNVKSTTVLGISGTIAQLLFFCIIGFLAFALPHLTATNIKILSGYVLVVTYLIDPMKRIMAMLPALGQANVSLQKIDTLGLSLASRIENTAQDKFALTSSFQKIELRKITHSYRHQHPENNFTIGPIDLTFHPGELIFIVGGNGSGKSTLAKIITGLYMPDGGEVCLDGLPITDENREAYRQLFSTVFADFYLFDRFLGINLENLDAQAQEYLKLLELDEKVQVQAGRFSTLELSQGQRKRLALLTAYLENRPIYLFDEWAADQDPYFREIFYKQLLPGLKNRGKTVIAISHDDRYFHLADRLIKLEYGQLVSI